MKLATPLPGPSHRRARVRARAAILAALVAASVVAGVDTAGASTLPGPYNHLPSPGSARHGAAPGLAVQHAGRPAWTPRPVSATRDHLHGTPAIGAGAGRGHRG